jgi:hypothetical protein
MAVAKRFRPLDPNVPQFLVMHDSTLFSVQEQNWATMIFFASLGIIRHKLLIIDGSKNSCLITMDRIHVHYQTMETGHWTMHQCLIIGKVIHNTREIFVIWDVTRIV